MSDKAELKTFGYDWPSPEWAASETRQRAIDAFNSSITPVSKPAIDAFNTESTNNFLLLTATYSKELQFDPKPMNLTDKIRRLNTLIPFIRNHYTDTLTPEWNGFHVTTKFANPYGATFSTKPVNWLAKAYQAALGFLKRTYTEFMTRRRAIKAFKQV